MAAQRLRRLGREGASLVRETHPVASRWQPNACEDWDAAAEGGAVDALCG